MVKAGVATALSLVLLLPTFNALNNSYVEDVQPPPWMPTPKDPPNIPPPDNLKPPPGTPPEGEGQTPLPSGGVPPCRPVQREIFAMPGEDLVSPSTPGQYARRATLEAPDRTLRLQGAVFYNAWRATEVRAVLNGPDGNPVWDDSARAEPIASAQASAPDSEFFYDSYVEAPSALPPAGAYELVLTAQFPLSGRVGAVFRAIVCEVPEG